MKTGAVLVAAVTVSVGLVTATTVYMRKEEGAKREHVRAAAAERPLVAPATPESPPPAGSDTSSDARPEQARAAGKRTTKETRPATKLARAQAHAQALREHRLADAARYAALKREEMLLRKKEKRPRKPDGITRAYVKAMTAAFGRLPAGDDRMELLNRVVAVRSCARFRPRPISRRPRP